MYIMFFSEFTRMFITHPKYVICCLHIENSKEIYTRGQFDGKGDVECRRPASGSRKAEVRLCNGLVRTVQAMLRYSFNQ